VKRCSITSAASPCFEGLVRELLIWCNRNRLQHWRQCRVTLDVGQLDRLLGMYVCGCSIDISNSRFGSCSRLSLLFGDSGFGGDAGCRD